MPQDTRRITFVSRNAAVTGRDWDLSPKSASKVILLDPQTLQRFAKGTALRDLDVERLIIDRSASPAEFLTFLAAVPTEFRGDILYINEDGSAFLSATGRGGDRILYSLLADDVRFYFEAHRLVTERLAVSFKRIPNFEVVEQPLARIVAA